MVHILQEMLAAAQKVFDEVNSSGRPVPLASDHASYLDKEAESMRWFLLPSEAEQALLGMATPMVTPPFQPRCYPSPVIPSSINSCNIRNVSPRETSSLQESGPQETRTSNGVSEQYEEDKSEESEKKENRVKFHCPSKIIYKPTTEVRGLSDN